MTDLTPEGETIYRVATLIEENSRLRKALEDAPPPPPEGTDAVERYAADCYRWYSGIRAEALKK